MVRRRNSKEEIQKEEFSFDSYRLSVLFIKKREQ
jgi:hypothetical protein